jgi:hypothetical protein
VKFKKSIMWLIKSNQLKSGRKMLKNILLLINLLVHYRKEPFFNLTFIIRRIFKNQLYSYPLGTSNSTHKIETRESDNGHWLKFNDIELLYPMTMDIENALDNFNSVITEQTPLHPHCYNLELIQPGWVIYDIGTAEGYQVFKYIKKVKKAILFEPDPEFYNCLKLTFSNEISEGKIILLNYGIRGKYSDNNKTNQPNLQPLEYLIEKFHLPSPDYIKADIEGNELHLIHSLEPLLKNNSIAIIEITTYHRPNDAFEIRKYLTNFGGQGTYSNGYIFLNIDGWDNVGSFRKLYQPVIRKVLYTHKF